MPRRSNPLEIAVDIATVPNLHNENYQNVVPNLIDHAVSPYPKPEEAFVAT